MSGAEFCSECNEAILWKCSCCNRENERSIHTYHPEEGEDSSSRVASVVGAILTVMSGVSIAITL